jgi:hypothetical protein
MVAGLVEITVADSLEQILGTPTPIDGSRVAVGDRKEETDGVRIVRALEILAELPNGRHLIEAIGGERCGWRDPSDREEGGDENEGS